MDFASLLKGKGGLIWASERQECVAQVEYDDTKRKVLPSSLVYRSQQRRVTVVQSSATVAFSMSGFSTNGGNPSELRSRFESMEWILVDEAADEINP